MLYNGENVCWHYEKFHSSYSAVSPSCAQDLHKVSSKQHAWIIKTRLQDTDSEIQLNVTKTSFVVEKWSKKLKYANEYPEISDEFEWNMIDCKIKVHWVVFSFIATF